jgi:hypothetical protein
MQLFLHVIWTNLICILTLMNYEKDEKDESLIRKLS